MSKREILVYFDHLSTAQPRFLGTLTPQIIRGKELFSFAFDNVFLNLPDRPPLDPDLQFYVGPQFTPKTNFGLFLDSAPFFRLSRDAAQKLLSRIRDTVSRFHSYAGHSAIPASEQEEMASAFHF